MVELEVQGSRERTGLRLMRGLPGTSCALLVLAACVPEPTPVPIVEEPRHRLASEREFAQVLDVQILGSDTTFFHIHERPIVYACVSGSEMATQPLGGEWSPPGSPCDPGVVFSNPEYADQPLTHRVANTGVDLFHLIAVQNLRDRSELATLEAGVPARSWPSTDTTFPRSWSSRGAAPWRRYLRRVGRTC
jgi:hypothetical protein